MGKMKFLKINYNDKIKKIMFKPEYKDYDKLMDTISVITKIDKENLRVNFKDIEDDIIELNDCHDLEYFYEQSIDSISMKLNIFEKINEYSQDFVKINEESKIEKVDLQKEIIDINKNDDINKNPVEEFEFISKKSLKDEKVDNILEEDDCVNDEKQEEILELNTDITVKLDETVKSLKVEKEEVKEEDKEVVEEVKEEDKEVVILDEEKEDEEEKIVEDEEEEKIVEDEEEKIVEDE